MKKDVFVLREYNNFPSITKAISSAGYKIENKTIEQGIVEANYNISSRLDVPLATTLFYMKRLRIVENEPRCIEKLYIELAKVKGMEDLDYNNKSFHEQLHRIKKIERLHTKEEILIVEPNEEESELLKLHEDEEILLIKGVAYMQDGEPLEYYELSSDTYFYRYRSLSSYNG
ncbi:MAG: GntR family transcriptional regulator [Erysipelotrichaceae bacterium]|nr:GntR family transcriptional regulator [Erysipelotrichaceae bacterium]